MDCTACRIFFDPSDFWFVENVKYFVNEHVLVLNTLLYLLINDQYWNYIENISGRSEDLHWIMEYLI